MSGISWVTSVMYSLSLSSRKHLPSFSCFYADNTTILFNETKNNQLKLNGNTSDVILMTSKDSLFKLKPFCCLGHQWQSLHPFLIIICLQLCELPLVALYCLVLESWCIASFTSSFAGCLTWWCGLILVLADVCALLPGPTTCCTMLLCPRVSALGGSDIFLFFPWKCAYNLDGSLESRVVLLASLM